MKLLQTEHKSTSWGYLFAVALRVIREHELFDLVSPQHAVSLHFYESSDISSARVIIKHFATIQEFSCLLVTG